MVDQGVQELQPPEESLVFNFRDGSVWILAEIRGSLLPFKRQKDVDLVLAGLSNVADLGKEQPKEVNLSVAALKVLFGSENENLIVPRSRMMSIMAQTLGNELFQCEVMRDLLPKYLASGRFDDIKGIFEDIRILGTTERQLKLISVIAPLLVAEKARAEERLTRYSEAEKREEKVLADAEFTKYYDRLKTESPI